MSDLTQSAIKAALEGRWDEAIEINTKLIKQNPDDIKALNRLGYALLQQGNFTRSIQIYKKVLDLDPTHPLADKNLKLAIRLEAESEKGIVRSKRSKNRIPGVFLKEPGKTKRIPLVNTTTRLVIDKRQIGEVLKINITKKCIEVRTLEGEYIGAFPDDISFHLNNFLKLGCRYTVHIYEINYPLIYVFVREVYRDPSIPEPTFKHFH